MFLLYSYFAMLLLGAAHSIDSRVPALGYLVTLILVVVVQLARPVPSSSTD